MQVDDSLLEDSLVQDIYKFIRFRYVRSGETTSINQLRDEFTEEDTENVFEKVRSMDDMGIVERVNYPGIGETYRPGKYEWTYLMEDKLSLDYRELSHRLFISQERSDVKQ